MWTLQRQALVIEQAFDTAYKAAGSWEERQGIIQQRDYEASEYWNAVTAFRSRKLATRAESCTSTQATWSGKVTSTQITG